MAFGHFIPIDLSQGMLQSQCNFMKKLVTTEGIRSFELEAKKNLVILEGETRIFFKNTCF
jgi:hypothetical protein